jgi:hypothetical protein
MAKEKPFITKKITNTDIYQMLLELQKNQEEDNTIHKEILAEAKKTNGRITTLEKYSLYHLIKRNPIQAIIITISATVLFVIHFGIEIATKVAGFISKLFGLL